MGLCCHLLRLQRSSVKEFSCVLGHCFSVYAPVLMSHAHATTLLLCLHLQMITSFLVLLDMLLTRTMSTCISPLSNCFTCCRTLAFTSSQSMFKSFLSKILQFQFVLSLPPFLLCILIPISFITRLQIQRLQGDNKVM